ncbi:uncharacterized protein CXQ87_001407 [Candidozyma duobushaemuli]|uniref:Uncharacterized protein n=1 Tax=Candidozyma duobushaemuli TaxID=1231522 RepID=A0A2V1AKQ0_9ASCO|nr:uncharacterized protein CXQ87_001407 [[Candida] duobushaemulonis]PVH18479.1 hypothetical protein CXQ87_001407 [[Candida] duobushaemulonis]
MDSAEEDHGPEVFETSDVESESGTNHVEESSESIARDALAPPSDAVSSYESSALSDELTLVDFSGNVARRLAQSGYNVEKLGETRKQKLARIARELEELEKEEPSEVEVLAGKFRELKAGEEKSGDFDVGVGDIFKNIESALKERSTKEYSESNEVLRLEKRIAELEEAIGSNEDTPTSIRNILNNASRKVNVLYDHEEEIAAVQTEIKSLSKDMEALAANRLSSLYDRLTEFDRVNAIVPSMIARLRSLNSVHAESGHAVECVATLDKTLSSLASDLKKWDDSVDKIDRSLVEQSEAFEKNAKVFQKKMEDVMSRIDKIEAKKV